MLIAVRYRHGDGKRGTAASERWSSTRTLLVAKTAIAYRRCTSTTPFEHDYALTHLGWEGRRCGR